MKTIKSLQFVLFFILLLPDHLSAQAPQVPSVIYFADMTLRINEHAKREIQADVNALYRNPNYFQIKLDRVNLYMPIVERVLREQGVPEDMKYLVIQESSLISDAVSTSNAVGFWQFKKGTAEEVFMRVDNQVDERKNIVSSTKGAALYLKKHQGHLDNWACALVSYQMGLGGARGYFGNQYKGKRTMDIDRNSHWYLKKFLAHKIAFEGQTGKLVSNGDYLHEYAVKGPTTLAAVAKNLGVSEPHLKEYNKWTSSGNIPGDRTYVVTYIQKGMAPVRPAIASDLPSPEPSDAKVAASPRAQAYPKLTGNMAQATQKGQVKMNGIKAVLASSSGPPAQLAAQTGIKEKRLRRLNDLKKSDRVVAGNYYYTKRKKGKAEAETHIVQQGETLWAISQMYGIRLHSLKAKNRIYKEEDLLPGMILKLRDYRRRGEAIQMAPPPSQPQARPVRAQVAESRPSGSNQAQAPASAAAARPQVSSSPNPPTPVQTQVLEHIVQPGDTLYAISRKHNVTVDQLRGWNNIGEDNILSVGQKLVIRK